MEEKKPTPAKGKKSANIYEGLAVFQGVCPPIKKEAEAKGTKFSYKYGDLAHIMTEILPHLQTAGLIVFHPIMREDDKLIQVTIVRHVESGTEITSEIEIPQVEFQGMNIYQSLGSGFTYLKRYQLTGLLAIVLEDEDNDAQGATKPKADKKAKTEPENPWLNPETGGMVNPTWAEAVRYLSQDGTMEKIKSKYRISKVNEEKLKNEALEYVEGFDSQPHPESEI